MRILIVGGVAGGASCAARARRLSETAEIIIFERGPYVSFANCGLPYHVGNVITDEDDLLVASPELFRERFNIDVRTRSNVRAIDPEEKKIEVENLETGDVYQEIYDALVLAPGSEPIRPALPGIEVPGIFTLWTIPDTREIIQWIKQKDARRVVVVGGGFIGLEMAENLKRLGMEVTIVEMQDHVMPVFDSEMGLIINEYLMEKGVELCLGSPVSGFKQGTDNTLVVEISTGKKIPADLVILSIGVRPRVELAENAGLGIGDFGGIRVDDQMRTSNPHIWAVGDAVEVKDVVTGTPTLDPLAGPANRQGRIAADVIAGKDSDGAGFRGVQATAVCGILGMTVASTGKTEKQLQKLSEPGELLPYEKIYLHPINHAGYYPGAERMSMKIIFRKKDGLILGAQAVGKEGVEKRIDVISMAIQMKGTIFDLEEAELCYSPQYGSAKDPVNMAGMTASNILHGLVDVKHWQDLSGKDAFVLDVRDPDEYEKGHVDHAVNIPLNDLRRRMSELPKEKEISIHCLVGIRSYYACRILSQNGYRVKNLSGGSLTYPYVKQLNPQIP